jgi:hypothetical protein
MQSKAQIDHILRQKSDAREIPGVVAMAANSKELIIRARSANATCPRTMP